MVEVEFEFVDDDLVQPHGHVHHADILAKLELARLHYLSQRDINYEQLLESKLFLVITRIEIDFLREVRGGRHKITVEAPSVEEKDLCVTQRIVNERGKDCVRAMVCSRLLDAERGRAIAPPEDIATKFRSVE